MSSCSQASAEIIPLDYRFWISVFMRVLSRKMKLNLQRSMSTAWISFCKVFSTEKRNMVLMKNY